MKKYKINSYFIEQKYEDILYRSIILGEPITEEENNFIIEIR